MGDNDMFG